MPADLFEEIPIPPKPTLTDEGSDAHNKLQRNVDVALDLHYEFMMADPESAGDKRLALESANTTIKAALATDRTALKARQENTIELVMLRVLFARKMHGIASKPEDEEKLRTAPRAKLETAIGVRGLAEYDTFKW